MIKIICDKAENARKSYTVALLWITSNMKYGKGDLLWNF